MRLIITWILSLIIGILSSVIASWVEPSLKKRKKVVIGVFFFICALSLLMLVLPNQKNTSDKESKTKQVAEDSILTDEKNHKVSKVDKRIDSFYHIENITTNRYLKYSELIYNNLIQKMSTGKKAKDTLFFNNTAEIVNGNLRLWNSDNTVGAGIVDKNNFKELFVSNEYNSKGKILKGTLWFRNTTGKNGDFPIERLEFNYNKTGEVFGSIYSDSEKMTKMSKFSVLNKLDNEIKYWTNIK